MKSPGFLERIISLYIQISDVLRVRDDESLTWVHGITHQHVKGAVGFGCIVHWALLFSVIEFTLPDICYLSTQNSSL
jgi:hypothetical protein